VKDSVSSVLEPADDGILGEVHLFCTNDLVNLVLDTGGVVEVEGREELGSLGLRMGALGLRGAEQSGAERSRAEQSGAERSRAKSRVWGRTDERGLVR